MEQSLKIRPTVYVGLGTTGMEILNRLRWLNHREYGEAGLPIFRYVSIETDAGKNGKDPRVDNDDHIAFSYEDGVPKSFGSGLPPRPYEVNEVIHTTLSSPEPVRDRVNPNSPKFDEHLASWLDERILDTPAVRDSRAGAGNIRMAGRLALWENWNKGSYVGLSLHAAYNTVRHQAHRQKAESILTTHFDQKIEVDSETHNIFIVGTLCGGTCSGMLLDIAYYFRHIGNEYTKIYGIFTMYNEGLALGGDARILLANCYASLVEQDFYERPQTEYRLTLPDGSEIREDRGPFNVATFLSSTNMEHWGLVTEGGEFETGQLNQMVATDLFVRSLGVDSLIETDLVNATARDSQFKKVRDVGDSHKNAFVQSMFSSGMDLVWLPKTALSSAAAGKFIDMLRGKWRTGEPVPGSPEADEFVPAEDDIKSALQIEAFDAKLKVDIDAINEDNFSTAARACLSALLARPGAKYYDESEANRAAYSQQYRERLNQAVDSFEGTSQLCRKQEFIQKIEARIYAELDNLGGDFPEDPVDLDPDIGKIVDDAEADNTTERKTNSVSSVIAKLLGMERPAGIKITAFQSRIFDERTKLREKFMDWCVGIPRVKETLHDLLSHIKELQGKVDKEIDNLDKRFETAVTFLPSGSSTGEIVQAAARLSELVHSSTDLGSPQSVEKLVNLMREVEPDAFRWHISHELQQSFQRFVPHLLRGFPFDKEADKRSSPYQEFTPYSANYRLDFNQKGGKTRLFRYLLAEEEMAEGVEGLKLTQVEPKGILVPNLRVLYQMEAGYTPDDIRVAGQLKKAYDAAQRRFKRAEDDPIHIHKDPDMFDQEAIRRAQEIHERIGCVEQEWRVLRELLPRIREVDADRFQSVFPNGDFNGTGSLNGDRTLDPGELTIKVVGKSGIQITFPDNEEGWEKLAADAVASGNFIDEIRSELGLMLDDFPPNLIELIDDLNGLVEKEESEEFYADYVNLLREHLETPQN